MFYREIILVAAVVGIGVGSRSAAEAAGRDSPLALRGDGAGQGVGARLIDGPAVGGQVDVFLIRLPGRAYAPLFPGFSGVFMENTINSYDCT